MEVATEAPVMTIAEAIQEAEHIRKMPAEYLVTQDKLKLINATLLSALEQHPCLVKALKNGEEVFPLTQHDRASVPAILHWAYEADDHGCRSDKVNEAFAIAHRWRAQDPASTRWPD